MQYIEYPRNNSYLKFSSTNCIIQVLEVSTSCEFLVKESLQVINREDSNDVINKSIYSYSTTSALLSSSIRFKSNESMECVDEFSCIQAMFTEESNKLENSNKITIINE
jgi:hypothetical protein